MINLKHEVQARGFVVAHIGYNFEHEEILIREKSCNK